MGTVGPCKRVGAAFLALALSACGGGGGTSGGGSAAPAVPQAASGRGNLSFSVTVPAASAAQSKGRSPQFISAATKSVSIIAGSSTTNIDVTSTSAGCSANVAQPAFSEIAIAAGAQPRGITKGPDGTMWFVEDSGGAIGNVSATGSYRRFSSGLLTNDLVVGPDGLLWIAQLYGTLQILRFDTTGLTFAAPFSTGSQPQATHLAVGGDNNVYYTPFSSNHALYKMTSSGSPAGAVATSGTPTALTLGPDGAIWFTENNGTNAWVARLTTAGVLNEFPLTTTGPGYIATGSDGALWFIDNATNKMYRMTTNGVVTNSFAITDGSADAIVNGPDGALWFTEYTKNLIGRLTTAGSLTEFPVPTPSSNPTNLAFSGDGTLYFTEQTTNKIGTLRLPVSCTSSANVPSGIITTKVTAYDATGGAAGSGHALSTQTLSVNVPANGTTTLNLTLNGIVNSVALTRTGPTGCIGPGSIALSLLAFDASGNTIVGSGNYADAAGNALTINLSSSGSGTLAPMSFTGPTGAQPAITYSSNFSSATVTATVSGGTFTGPISGSPLFIPSSC